MGVSPRYLEWSTASTVSVLMMMGLWGAEDHFSCFTNIKVKVVLPAPLGEAGDSVVIFLNWMCVCEKAKNGFVIN